MDSQSDSDALNDPFVHRWLCGPFEDYERELEEERLQSEKDKRKLAIRTAKRKKESALREAYIEGVQEGWASAWRDRLVKELSDHPADSVRARQIMAKLGKLTDAELASLIV